LPWWDKQLEHWLWCNTDEPSIVFAKLNEIVYELRVVVLRTAVLVVENAYWCFLSFTMNVFFLVEVGVTEDVNWSCPKAQKDCVGGTNNSNIGFGVW
jgi:hypothetical protein